MNRGTGRRKNAIARVRLQPGEGRVTVNEKDPLAYLGRRVLEMAALAPLRVTNTQRKFDITIKVIGGGTSGQAGAIAPGIARALCRSDHLGHLPPEGRDALTAYGVAVVIDLRSASEVLSKPNPFADGTAARYLHHELVDDANMNNIGDSESMFDRYLFIVNNRPQAFRDVLTSLAA